MLGFWCREYLGKLRFWSLNGGVMLVVCVFISEIANHFAYANTLLLSIQINVIEAI